MIRKFKYMIIICVILVIAVVSILVICRTKSMVVVESKINSGNFVENELVGIFDTKDEALEAAKLYRIELKSYEREVAVFTVSDERNLNEIIDEGNKKGWPQLSKNTLGHLN